MRNITYKTLFAGITLFSVQALATDISLTTGLDYTNFSDSRGVRQSEFLEIKNKIDQGAIVIRIADGKRDFSGNDSWNALSGRTTLWYDWGARLSTRTSLSVSENTPVFARKDIQQSFSIKLLPFSIITAGYRFANYYGNTDVNAFSGAYSFYQGPFISSWRYTYYNTQGVGGSFSNIITLRINDKKGAGNTQIWLSKGTGAFAYDWYPETRKGKMQSLSLRRVQPLSKTIVGGLTIGKQWNQTPVGNYHSLQAAGDITWFF